MCLHKNITLRYIHTPTEHSGETASFLMPSSSHLPTSLPSPPLPSPPLSQVHHGKDCGFFVFDSGQGYMEANDIYSNRIAGVEIKSQANPVFYKNLIHHGKTGGVYIHEKVRGGKERKGEGPVVVEGGGGASGSEGRGRVSSSGGRGRGQW